MEKVERKNWFWCLHCQRAFKSEFKKDEIKECPFGDCDGGKLDIWEWEEIRDQVNDKGLFPETPEGTGKKYLLP